MSLFRTRSLGIVLASIAVWIGILTYLQPFSYLPSPFPRPASRLKPLAPQAPLKSCTPQTAVVRKDWNKLSKSERLIYIDAVKCIHRLPSVLPPGLVPASLNFYDDFIAVHVNNTPKTHKTAIFLPWHRHFNLLFENALHKYCHYPLQMGIPYWNWPHTEFIDPSELFSPWPTQAQPDHDLPDFPPNYHCVHTGAFANTTVRFGPIDVGGTIDGPALAEWELPRPHCLARNQDYSVITKYLSHDAVAAALAAPTIDEFSLHVAGRSTEFALHGRAHLAIGGHMADSFCATADPTFWLHHSMIDRLWDKWQRAEPTRRFVHCCENGTELFRNPEDKRVGGGTVMHFGVLGEEVTLAGVADTMRGGESAYCYRYE